MLNSYSEETVKRMSRLKPINKISRKQNVFHNMTFVIFCPKHRKIAVSDNFGPQRELAIWFPFVYLSSHIKKRITIEEGICLILSGDNHELMTLNKEEQPFESKFSYIFSENVKHFKFGFTRFVCSVRLHSDNPVLQCCRKTSRIIWLDIEQVLNNCFDCFWGKQIRNYSRKFDEVFQRLRITYYMNKNLFCERPLTDSGKQVLKSLNITEKQIQSFYIDFIEHCFPSVYMSFLSFKDYLRKYDFKISEKLLKRFYSGFMKYGVPFNPQRDYGLHFKELLIGLALIDNQSISNDCRIAFIFRYYDFDREQYLSKEEFREMIEDIHENETSDMIDIFVADYWFIIDPSESGVSFAQFRQSLLNQSIVVPDTLCQHESKILLKIISTLETRNEGIVSRIKTFVSHYCRNLLKKI